MLSGAAETMKYAPTDAQRALVESTESAVVIAGPGRGKTATALAAAKHWLDTDPSRTNVLFTSFSNAAVSRIADSARIELSGVSKRLQFRTFHACAMELLRDYGRFVGLRAPAKVLDSTEEKLLATEKGWNTSRDAEYTLELRRTALETGRVSFSLMLPLATSLLEASPTLRQVIGLRYPFIIVDEFQDTNADQWRFLRTIGEHSRVMVLGDPNQMIYGKEYREVAARIQEFERWKGVTRTTFDGHNFRCGVRTIVGFAEALLNGEQVPRDPNGVQLYPTHQTAVRTKLVSIWLALRKRYGDEISIAFITPSAKAADQISETLATPKAGSVLPMPLYTSSDPTESAVDAFRFVVYAAADYRIVSSEKRATTLTNAICVFAAEWNRKAAISQTLADKLSGRLKSARAKSPLRDYIRTAQIASINDFAIGLVGALTMEPELTATMSSFTIRMKRLPDCEPLPLGRDCLFDSYRDSRSPIGLVGSSIGRGRTVVLSMYRAKGREFDAVILLCDPRQHSPATPLDELRRLHYVAATRGRRWLGVVYPPLRLGPVLTPVITNV